MGPGLCLGDPEVRGTKGPAISSGSIFSLWEEGRESADKGRKTRAKSKSISSSQAEVGRLHFQIEKQTLFSTVYFYRLLFWGRHMVPELGPGGCEAGFPEIRGNMFEHAVGISDTYL